MEQITFFCHKNFHKDDNLDYFCQNFQIRLHWMKMEGFLRNGYIVMRQYDVKINLQLYPQKQVLMKSLLVHNYVFMYFISIQLNVGLYLLPFPYIAVK